MRREEQRRAAVFALYQHDVTGRALEETLPRDASAFTRALAAAADERTEELDELIERHADGLDRRAHRAAGAQHHARRAARAPRPGAAPSDRPIPAEGAIDEAVETAKAYCSAQAPAFVNGILGAALRELRQNGAST